MTDKKVALVTGANKGIGLEIVRQLASQGFAVVLAGRDGGRVEAAAKSLTDQGLDVRGIALDVTKPESAEAAARQVEQQFGRLDVLVNNAGISNEFASHVRPSELDLDALKTTYETNVFGVFAVTRAFLPLLRKSSSGRIINQSSTLGSLEKLSDPKSPYYGNNLLAYNSSKSALNGLTVALAKDLAEAGISVNSTCPGWVQTDMGGAAAPRTVDQGAAIAVKLATMDTPPTGQYLDDGGVIPW